MLKMNPAPFLRDEGGQITVDWTVLVAALMGLGFIVVAEVATGVEKVTDGYDGINSGQGLMTMFVSNPAKPTSVIADTPDAVAGADDSAQACNAANPGNDKCVGNAGETPNGDEDAWGDGSNGQSDAHDDKDHGDDDGDDGDKDHGDDDGDDGDDDGDKDHGDKDDKDHGDDDGDKDDKDHGDDD